MSHKYHAIGSAQFAERLTKGFKGGNYSENGTYVIGDKGDNESLSWVIPIPRPNHISAEDAPNWPELTEDEAYKNKAICKLEDIG